MRKEIPADYQSRIEKDQEPYRSPDGRDGITHRAFLIGTAASLLVGAGVAYADNFIRGSNLALDLGSPAALFLLFVLVILLNPLLGWVRRVWYLSTAEVSLVYIMALVATSIASMGLTPFLLAYTTGAQYYASPENRWGELFVEHVPKWMVLQDPLAIQYFYEGNPQGISTIPWGAWMPALLAWLPFLIALYLFMIALMVILRRQWMDHERLLYPLMQPSLAMIAQERGRLLPPLFRSWLFWLGLSLPFGIGTINALHAYFHFVPEIDLYPRIMIFRNTTLLRLEIRFAAIGFAYFLSQEISLGIWVLNLVAKMQEGSLNVFGISGNERMEWVTEPILAHQSMGAMIALVLIGLWMGRRHLAAVLRKAFGADVSVEDRDEMMSYRAAVFLILGGGAFMWWWLWQSGLPAWAAAVVLSIALVIFLGLTRMVTEGGFFLTRAPMNPGNFAVSGFGVEALGSAGVTALGYSFVWAGELRIFAMAACANALKMAECIRGSRRILLWAMLVAILVSAAGSIWVTLSLCYKYGGINTSWIIQGLVRYPFSFISRNIANGTPLNWDGWLWTACGGAYMGLLTFLKQRLLWWPIHPISLPISTLYMTDMLMLSVFIAWLVKALILKYGGPKLFDRGKPFFVGLVVGQFTCMGFWIVVDHFTGMKGNIVYWM